MVNDINTLMSLGAATESMSAQKLPGELGKDDFLNLLVTQLQNQDPLEPSEATDFTAQLAQFSSLEELMNIGKGISNLMMYEESMNNANAVTLIGKEVKALGGTIQITDDSVSGAYFELPDDAESVTVCIYDKDHNLVKKLDLGPQTKGEHEINWDGLGEKGNALPDGTYTVEIDAFDADDNPIEVTRYIFGKVEGVLFEEGLTWLLLGKRQIALSDIVSVKNETQDS